QQRRVSSTYHFHYPHPPTSHLFPLSLHDALPIYLVKLFKGAFIQQEFDPLARRHLAFFVLAFPALFSATLFGQDVTALQLRKLRSEEHTSELQSRGHLVCRLLLEKKNRSLY